MGFIDLLFGFRTKNPRDQSHGGAYAPSGDYHELNDEGMPAIQNQRLLPRSGQFKRNLAPIGVQANFTVAAPELIPNRKGYENKVPLQKHPTVKKGG